jgi:bacillopeptidase F
MQNTPYYNTMSNSQHISSRRAKVEQKKLMRQTVGFGVLALVCLAFFGFIVIPGVIRWVGGLGGTAQLTTDTDVAPQVPVIETPFEATSSAKLTLNGFNQKGNQVAILDNTEEVQRVSTNDDGSFHADLTLQKGENKISAFAINSAGKESSTSTEFTVMYSNEPPKLEVTEPTDHQAVQGKKNQNVTFKGTTDPKTKVYINDRLIFVGSDGSFSATQRLENGENKVSVKSIDQAGNVTEKVVTVNFSE